MYTFQLRTEYNLITLPKFACAFSWSFLFWLLTSARRAVIPSTPLRGMFAAFIPSLIQTLFATFQDNYQNENKILMLSYRIPLFFFQELYIVLQSDSDTSKLAETGCPSTGLISANNLIQLLVSVSKFGLAVWNKNIW